MKEIFPDVFSRSGRIYTESLVPGKSVYGEKLAEGGKYREWIPNRSKLCAAIKKGLSCMPIKGGSKILYLGASTGTTVSHISDIVGTAGIVYAVEFSERVFRELAMFSKARQNIVPVLSDARKMSEYWWIEECGCVYCDIAQPDQTEIALRNAREFLSEKGYLMIAVKSQSIDVTKKPEKVYAQESEKIINAGFSVNEIIDIEPFEEKHAFIVARKK